MRSGCSVAPEPRKWSGQSDIMVMPTVAVVLGLLLLVWASERFVIGASAIARNLCVSPLMIGLTVVGIGTSAPEIFVSATAAASGFPEVAIGNALGSNIANMGLVVGATALVVPLSIRSRTLKREFLLMFVVFALAGVLLSDQVLSRVDGVLLMSGFAALMGLMCVISLNARRRDPLGDEYAQEIPDTMPTLVALMWLIVGLVTLLIASRMIVWGAVEIARLLGVSDLIMGLTIVAIGTSLPELAASIASGLKGEPDIAIGNIIGSNMFNVLPVLALPGLIAPGVISPEVWDRDYVVMLGVAVLLFLVAYGFRGPGRVNRFGGGLLLAVFGAYQVLLYQQAMA